MKKARGRVVVLRKSRRAYQVASSSFAMAIAAPKVSVETEGLRRRAVELMRAQSDEWFADPVCSLMGGRAKPGGTRVATVDAFGKENGYALLSDMEDAKEILESAKRTTVRDVDRTKDAVRRAEARLFGDEFAPVLIANQAMDFHKQDGVTEIEEALQVGPIERAMNDELLDAERRGVLRVDRSAALVLCVSNFSNFLDLSRKVLRNIECGVPVVILSRGNTSQHCFRWAKLLASLLDEEPDAKEDKDQNRLLVNFLSCDLSVQRQVLADESQGDDDFAAYLTGSRRAAGAVKELVRRTFASCGGPNTMVLCSDAAFDLGAFAAAARESALIEHSGQCTALRHVVAPGAHTLSDADFEKRFLPPSAGTSSSETVVSMNAAEALENRSFSALLTEAPSFLGGDPYDGESGSVADDLRKQGYVVAGDPLAAAKAAAVVAADGGQNTTNTTKKRSFSPALTAAATKDRVAWRVTPQTAPARDWKLEEHWRKVVLDISSPPSRAALLDEKTETLLADWLLEQQPISVAVNKLGVVDPEALRFARRLWEKSACSVFTVGDAAKPAITPQARPQDGELFGEVPPRSVLDKFTVSPVIVPTSTPGQASYYEDAYLRDVASGGSQAADDDEDSEFRTTTTTTTTTTPPGVLSVVANCDSPETRGYCLLLWRYLSDAACGPRRNATAERACLYGLQRPPLGKRGVTWLRVSHLDDFDSAAPALVAFVATNASAQLRASVHPQNTACLDRMANALGDGFVADVFARKLSDAEFEADVRDKTPWNVVRAADYDSGAKASSPGGAHFGLVSTFVARLFPIGHVKSTRQDDLPFLHAFADSPKWLRAAGHLHRR